MSSLRLADRADAPYYLPLGNEVELFRACHERALPVMLKGPTGCGKTRFVEHMAWRLRPGQHGGPTSMVTVACHEDLTATDLVGRYLLSGNDTVWIDGPLTRAVRVGTNIRVTSDTVPPRPIVSFCASPRFGVPG